MNWEEKLGRMIRTPYLKAYGTNNVFMNEVTLVVNVPQSYCETGMELSNPDTLGIRHSAWDDVRDSFREQWIDSVKERLEDIDGLKITDTNYSQGKITVMETNRPGALAEALQLDDIVKGHSTRQQRGWYL